MCVKTGKWENEKSVGVRPPGLPVSKEEEHKTKLLSIKSSSKTTFSQKSKEQHHFSGFAEEIVADRKVESRKENANSQ